MIGGLKPAPSLPADMTALMQLVDFILLATKEPERIREAVEQVHAAKDEMLAQLASRQAEIDRSTRQNEAKAAHLAELETKLAKWQDDIETAGREHAEHVMAESTRLHNAQIELDARTDEVMKREAYWNEQTQALAERERAQAQQHKDAMDKVALLEAAVRAQSEALQKAIAQAEAKQTDYESKLAKLKALAE